MIGTRGVCLSLVVKMNGQNNKKTSDLSWYLTRILVSWLGCLMLGEERGQPVIQTASQSARKLVVG